MNKICGIFKRATSILFVLAIMSNSVFASVSLPEATYNSFTLYSYLKDLGIEDNYSNVALCTVEFSQKSEDDGTIATVSANETNEEYGILVRSQNEDGTITDSVFFSTYMDYASGEMNALITESVASQIITNGNNMEVSVANDNIMLAVPNYSYYGRYVTFCMSATYSVINMSNYGRSGKAYHPVSSTFEIAKNTTVTPSLGSLDFITVISSQHMVLTEDPNTTIGPYYYPFDRTYTTTSPVFDYEYSFNDYTYYTNYDDGLYDGYHLLVYSVGSYFIKIESTDYPNGNGIRLAYNIHTGVADEAEGVEDY